jgi:hypothetical protein
MEGNVAQAAEKVIVDIREALNKAGVDSGELFELGLSAEELVAIGGNLHKRGSLIEAKAAERRDELLRS